MSSSGGHPSTLTPSAMKKSKHDSRQRSATDSFDRRSHTSIPHNLSAIFDAEMEATPYKARLYQLFGLIEKEFDTIYAENCKLHAQIAALTDRLNGEGLQLPPEVLVSDPVSTETSKGSARKQSAMQMGQKLRTALRGPPTRLVFKVGGGSDSHRFSVQRRFEGHRDGVWHVAASTQHGIVASASADQTARVWSLDSGACLYTYVGHTGSVNCVAIAQGAPSEQGDALMATSSGDESAHIWRASTQAAGSSEEDGDCETTTEAGDNADPSTHGHRIRSPLLRLTGHTGPVSACKWAGPAGAGPDRVLTASWDRTAHIYDVERGEVLNILSGHEQELDDCAVHASQLVVATASRDTTFRLWDFRDTIQSVAVFQAHNDAVTSVAFAPGDKIVSGSDDRTVKIWDMRNMRCALSTIRLTSASNRLAVAAMGGVGGGGAIAIPHDSRHVRLYDLNGVRLPRVPFRRCHHRMVCCVAWAEDHPSANLITCGFDRQVVGWKVVVGKDKE